MNDSERKLKMEISKTIKEFANFCMGAYINFNNIIYDLSKRCEVKNRIANLSNYDFVTAFDYTANAICERRITPNTETYLSLGEKAIELLASGKEQADVLYYFDELLRKEDEGK